MGTQPQAVVMSLAHNHATSLFISSYRGARRVEDVFKTNKCLLEVFFTCDQLFGALIHLNYSDINLFLFTMPGVNYLI